MIEHRMKRELRPARRVVACLAAWASLGSAAAWSQESLAPFFPEARRVVISERSDFSRYEDGRYVGHAYREARLDLDVELAPGGKAAYRGSALVLEETMHDERAVSRRLDGVVPIAFEADPGGSVRFSTDEGYPILRGIPSSPPAPVQAGGRWTGSGVVVVRPKPGSPATRIPVLVEYEFIGTATYGGAPALALRGRYAVRYRGGDRHGDAALTGSSGGRTADIMLDAANGQTLFVRETVDETYAYAGGASVRLKGFILHFHHGSLPADRERIAALIQPPVAGGSRSDDGQAGAGGPGAGGPGTGGPGTGGSAAPAPTIGPAPVSAPVSAAIAPPLATGAFEVATGERGVVLLLYDLRFVADGDELLASERGRLDAIADALKKVPERTFLVEGHSADLGRPAGQYELSERRARRIVDELVARGLPAGRFVYRGLGADMPVAPNDTESNRARNRRVEITILD